MPDKTEKTKMEEMQAAQRKFADAIESIIEYYRQKSEQMQMRQSVVIISTEGIVAAVGDRWEMAGLLDHYANEMKKDIRKAISERDDRQKKFLEEMNKRKMEEAAKRYVEEQKAKEAAKSEQPEPPIAAPVDAPKVEATPEPKPESPANG